VNKLANLVTIFFCFFAAVLTLILRFELDIFTIKWNHIPYTVEIYLGLSMLIGMVGVLRAVIRRRNFAIFKDESKFELIIPMSKSAVSHVTMYLILEIVFMSIFGFYFFLLFEPSMVLGLVLLVLVLEQIIFTIQCQKKGFCRMGMTTLAFLSVDREADVLYYNGLKKIEVDLGRIQFDYKEDIQLSIRKENINPEDRAAFDTTLRKCLSKKNIYYSDSYSKYVEKV
jgi:hypothetical protein